MGYRIEAGGGYLPLPDLRDKSVVQGLIKNEGTPVIIHTAKKDGSERLLCLIKPREGRPMRGNITSELAIHVNSIIREELPKIIKAS